MRDRQTTPRQIRAEAEAAAWLARLQSDARSDATDAGLRAWLDADELHRDAFERATGIWDMIPGAAQLNGYGEDGKNGSGQPQTIAPVSRHVRQLALAVLAFVLIGCGLAVWQMNRQPSFSVPPGAMQIATLEDGSRVSINTDSNLDVDFSSGTRRVKLREGEALFEVEHDASRPFVVEAGEERIVALGTSFVVRNIGGRVSVTLIEGRVSIASEREPTRKPIVLTPGERWSVTTSAQPTIDRPLIPAATAWRQGKAIFSDTTLAEAAAEMNRYGGPQIRVTDPRAASLPISGMFDTDDHRAFAEAVGSLHGLKLAQRGSDLFLSEGKLQGDK